MAQCGVAQRRLHHPLAVIKAPANRETHYVVAPAGQLLLLRRRHQAFGIQHRNLDPTMPVKCRGHGAPGITGGGDQDLQRPAGTAARLRQCRRQKARTKVLERGRWAVKQLQHLQARLVTKGK